MPTAQDKSSGLLERLEEAPDLRRGRALRYRPRAVPTKGAGRQGGRHPETSAKALLHQELDFLGCPSNRRMPRYEARSDTIFQRVRVRVEPSALEREAQSWLAPRCWLPQVLAGDGQRIRGANRLSLEDAHRGGEQAPQPALLAPNRSHAMPSIHPAGSFRRAGREFAILRDAGSGGARCRAWPTRRSTKACPSLRSSSP